MGFYVTRLKKLMYDFVRVFAVHFLLALLGGVIHGGSFAFCVYGERDGKTVERTSCHRTSSRSLMTNNTFPASRINYKK
jgi:hypothetical protein